GPRRARRARARGPGDPAPLRVGGADPARDRNGPRRQSRRRAKPAASCPSQIAPRPPGRTRAGGAQHVQPSGGLMTRSDTEAALAASNPLTAQAADALPLRDAEAELLEGIVAIPAHATRREPPREGARAR